MSLSKPGTGGQDGLDLRRQEFNYERPHEALNMRCPGEVYLNSERSYTGTPEDVDYPGMLTRRVTVEASIEWKSARYFISTSLAGWSVGLKPVQSEQLKVFFGRLLRGWIDPTTEAGKNQK